MRYLTEYLSPLTPVRAIVVTSGSLGEVTDAQLGTGKKPVVVYQGDLKERATIEGEPVVMSGGQGTLRTLNAASEELLI